MSKVAVILPAAGASSRYRDPHYKKPFAPLAGRAVWLHSAEPSGFWAATTWGS
jgi:2-C-methyl-D-erythritol 4-phosphate cytidylyltransferase